MLSFPPPFPSFSPTSVSGINQKHCDIRFFQKITFLVDFQISTNFLLTSFVVLLILMKMSQTILCSTTYVPFHANLNLLKKNKHLSQSFQFIYFTVGFVVNELNFLDLLIILLHCDLICLPTKWFPYTVLFFNSVTKNSLLRYRSFFHEIRSYGLYRFPIILHSICKLYANNSFLDNNS